jgi:hypothetical protein
MISFTKALSFFATMLVATADPIREPARLRINSDLLKTVFHSGDQRILEVFKDLEMGSVEQLEGSFAAFILEDMTASITTVKGLDPDKYDFDMSLNDPNMGFLGF